MMRKVWIAVGCVVLYMMHPAPVVTSTTCTTPLPCESSATSAGGVLLVCPAGDGPTLSDIGATISVTILWCTLAEPLADLPPQDVWIMSKILYDSRLCSGYRSSDADGLTDINGQTTVSGSIAAGGYFGDGVYVVALGGFIQLGESQSGEPCDNPLPLILVSPDINGDLVVESADFALFAAEFLNGGGTPDPRMDFNGDGLVESVDFALFALHFNHQCE